jgi:hypothetical protein
MPTSAPLISDDAIRAELHALLASQTFARARSLARLLNYLCEKCLRGEADQIKEYTIAVEAYHRSADFQQKENSLVRVEIKRLREKLQQFYETEGATHSLRIVIPVGQYAPTFIPQTQPAKELLIEESETVAVESPPAVRPLQPWIWAGVSVMLVAGVFWWGLMRRTPGTNASATPVAGDNAAPVVRSATATGEIRILAGSPVAKFIDRAGKVWQGDRYFTGGKAIKTPMSFVARTLDPELYQNSRQGDFQYDIPLPPGQYELRLHFAEDFYGPRNRSGGGETSRLFGIRLNDEPLIGSLDIYSDAGGENTADVRVFRPVRPAADGLLHLRFTTWQRGLALLNALEVLPLQPGAAQALRLVAGDKPIYTADGQEWLPCGYFDGGRSVARSGPLSATTQPELYQSEHFGHFSLALPVAPGRYKIKLYFAERFFGSASVNSSRVRTGAGSRVFHLFCNGEALLKNFDIFKEAGGADRALVRQFSGLTPDAQGKLLLEFKPVINYPLLNAVEVIAEAQRP